MGTGVRTYVTSTAPYFVLLALVLLVASPPLAVGIGASFGLGRALMAVERSLSFDGREWDQRLGARVAWVAPACSSSSALALAWAAANIGF